METKKILKLYYTSLGSVFSAIAFVLLVAPMFSIELQTNAIAGFAGNVSAAEDTNPPGWLMDTNSEVQGLVDTSLREQFRLRIPAAGVDRKVISNVDPANENVYGPIINNYIAHGKYTKLPDEGSISGNVYLFAHRSGEYLGQDVGYFKDLDEVDPGELAYIDYAGKTYVYEAYESFILDPKDTWVYTAKSPFPSLTLQTCENGEEQRLIVRFRLLRVDS
ncbi:MAG: sortase [Candidatus Dojkabacteria bacterium]